MANKPYRTNVVFQLGLVEVHLDLWSVKVTGAGESLFRNVCPDCTDAVKPNQRYICPRCKSDHSSGELEKARPTDKNTLVKLTTDDLQAVKAAYPTRLSEVRICPAEEFENESLASGTAYALVPSKGAGNMGYHILKELVANPDQVLYGKVKMDDSAEPKPYRLSIWRNELLFQEIIPPTDLDASRSITDGQPDIKYVVMAKTLAAQIVAPLDADFLADKRRERINEILAAKAAGSPVEAVAAPPVPVTDNLMAALEASLAAGKRMKEQA
jgi:non-homologous end joining protein Ku